MFRPGALSATAVSLAAFAPLAVGQTFQRLGTCPSLGCVLPADQTEFWPGQLFDLRLEIHAPVNGSEAYAGGVPDENFTFCIQKNGGDCESVTEMFKREDDAELEKWEFEWYEDLFAQDAGTASVVNVASKVYRALSFDEPGEYVGYLKYYNGHETVAHYKVHERPADRKAKNVVLFIGDGMAPAMITAARMLGHKSINGKYQSRLAMEQMDTLGLQMSHSVDSYITDSANSATAIYSGMKSRVNALNVYVDSSPNSFDDPKRETFAEIFKRHNPHGKVGMVSTAYIADATPAALCAHTADRGEYSTIVEEYLYGPEYINNTYTWPTSCSPDVIFGAGAEQFLPGDDFGSPNNKDYYEEFRQNGFQVALDRDELLSLDHTQKALGMFATGNLPVWLDRNVYPETLKGRENSPKGDGSDALNLPGLKDMTLEAISILKERSCAEGDDGFVMMAEAASIDKQAHALDYDRSLGDLLELDDTVRATLKHLEDLGIADETLVIVTADHGHGFDVYGSVDTKYLNAQEGDRAKRGSVGTYHSAGLSGYQATSENPQNQTVVYGDQGYGFPVKWDPRYTAARGYVAFPDHRESWQVNKTSPRDATVSSDEYGQIVNPADQPNGFVINGTLDEGASSGVHSMVDVAVFASGPGSSLFRGVYDNTDIFFKIAEALGIGA